MSAETRKLISFAVPVFNEEANVRRLYDTVQAVMAPLAERYRWEYVFTDNHSTNRTFELLTELAAADPAVRAFASPATSATSGPSSPVICRLTVMRWCNSTATYKTRRSWCPKCSSTGRRGIRWCSACVVGGRRGSASH